MKTISIIKTKHSTFLVHLKQTLHFSCASQIKHSTSLVLLNQAWHISCASQSNQNKALFLCISIKLKTKHFSCASQSNSKQSTFLVHLNQHIHTQCTSSTIITAHAQCSSQTILHILSANINHSTHAQY